MMTFILNENYKLVELTDVDEYLVGIRQETTRLVQEAYYNTDNKYYFGSLIPEGDYEVAISNFANKTFAIVYKGEYIIGYLSFHINWEVRRINNLGLMRLTDDYSLVPVLRNLFYFFFNYYKVNSVEFFAFTASPYVRGYRKLIARAGGREVGVLHGVERLMDNTVADAVIFEITKDEYKEKRAQN